jgi:hypothetical protein
MEIKQKKKFRDALQYKTILRFMDQILSENDRQQIVVYQYSTHFDPKCKSKLLFDKLYRKTHQHLENPIIFVTSTKKYILLVHLFHMADANIFLYKHLKVEILLLRIMVKQLKFYFRIEGVLKDNFLSKKVKQKTDSLE